MNVTILQTFPQARPCHFSMILCSRYPSEERYDQLGGADNPLADSVLDRIVHDTYEIRIEAINPDKDIAMRKIYSAKVDDEG